MTKTTINTNTIIINTINAKIAKIENVLAELRTKNDYYINTVDIPYYEDVLKGYYNALNKLAA